MLHISANARNLVSANPLARSARGGAQPTLKEASRALIAPARPTTAFRCSARAMWQKQVKCKRYALRTNFLESVQRLPFFRQSPPTRIWVSSRRLPLMHRYGWTGKKSTSNTCHAWFVWQAGAEPEPVHWFDWKDYFQLSIAMAA